MGGQGGMEINYTQSLDQGNTIVGEKVTVTGKGSHNGNCEGIQVHTITFVSGCLSDTNEDKLSGHKPCVGCQAADGCPLIGKIVYHSSGSASEVLNKNGIQT